MAGKSAVTKIIKNFAIGIICCFIAMAVFGCQRQVDAVDRQDGESASSEVSKDAPEIPAFKVLKHGNEEAVHLLNPGEAFDYYVKGGEPVIGSNGYVADSLSFSKVREAERLVFTICNTGLDYKTYQATVRPTYYRFGLMAGRKKAELYLTVENSTIPQEQLANFSQSKYIEKVEELKICDWIWYIITFKQPVEAKVSEQHNPGRVVIDITPFK